MLGFYFKTAIEIINLIDQDTENIKIETIKKRVKGIKI